MNRFRTFLFATIAVCVLPSVVSADDAARDWSSSMSYRTSGDSANIFNMMAAIRDRQRGGAAGTGGAVVNCQVAGACPQGGTTTQWNGVTVTTVTGSSGVGVDTTIDADSEQDAKIGSCSATGGCVVEIK